MTILNLQVLSRAMAVLMAILVASPAIGLGQVLYFCTMTGEVGPRCCCGHEDEATAPDGPTLGAPSCCEVVGTDKGLQPIRVEVVSPEFEAPLFVALPYNSDDGLLSRAPTGLALPDGSRGPPPDTGPPLFVRNCSYLI